MLKGSCLCGAIRYESGDLIAPIVNCHCVTCRKAHGAAFSSVGRVPRSEFRWNCGAEKLGHFESSRRRADGPTLGSLHHLAHRRRAASRAQGADAADTARR